MNQPRVLAKTAPLLSALGGHRVSCEHLRPGLIEAFVYIDRMDADIAKDYSAYSEKNRSLLVRYIREFWLGEAPVAEK